MNKNKDIEIRNIRASKVEVRSGGKTGRILCGKIAYNSRSEFMGFYEVILPGAFTESLRTQEVQCYWSHDASQILGRQSNGTMRLRDTPSALEFECDLDPATTWGSNAIAALKRGDVIANSFGFVIDGPHGDAWTQQGDTVVRQIKKALLYECSPVSSPAYSANQSYLRNAPTDIKALLKRTADDDDSVDGDDNEDDDNEEYRCACDCFNCLHDNCEGCTDDECDDDDCDLCPAQSQRALVCVLLKRKIHA